MIMTADNTDLRRRRREADLTLDDVAALLYGPDLAEATRPAISRFERGLRPDLPHGLGRRDYERVLDRAERNRNRGK